MMKMSFIIKSVLILMLLGGISSGVGAEDYGVGNISVSVYYNDQLEPGATIEFLTEDAEQIHSTKNLGTRYFIGLKRGKAYTMEVCYGLVKTKKDFIMPLSGSLHIQVDLYDK